MMEYEAVKRMKEEIKRLGGGIVNCIKDGKYTGDSCFGCPIKVDNCEIRDKVYRKRWVPISERPPEEKGEYLVTYHPCYWDNVNDKICTGTDTFRGKSKWAKEKYQKVIAWMPKPEPYKPEQRMEEAGTVAEQYADADTLRPAT